YWGRPRIAHHQPRCDKRMGRHDDFISSTNTVTAENQMERVQTIPHSNAIVSIAISSEFFLEDLKLAIQNISPRFDHPLVYRIQFIFNFQINNFEIEERNLHGFVLTAAIKTS